MDGLFLACLMGICGMPMSAATEDPALVSVAGSTVPVSAPVPAPSGPPLIAQLGAGVSIAAPVRTVEQPVERPVPLTGEPEADAGGNPDGVTAASSAKTSRAAIGDVVRKHAAAVRHCYETGLADDPAFSGTIEAAWRIQVDGKVTSVTIVGGTSRNAVVERCLVTEIPRWEFPRTAEPTVIGTFPFVFDATTLARHGAPTAARTATASPARKAR